MRTPPRVLIADDNPLNVDILQTRLAAHGYDILTAGDGERALALAREAQPDLLLLDVMMPGLDGIEVCRRLKADPDLPFMPVVLVTAKTDSRDVVAGLEAGADEYLTKPVDQAALVEVVLSQVAALFALAALHRVNERRAKRLRPRLRWKHGFVRRARNAVPLVEALRVW